MKKKGKTAFFRPSFVLFAFCAMIALAAGYIAGDLALAGKETRISGQVRAADGGPLMGIVAIESGRLYNKNYRYGGFVDEKGRFSVVVPEGGDFGLHIYATGYVYFPVGIEVKDGEDNHFSYAVPPNPAQEDVPVISGVSYEPPEGGTGRVVIRLTVNDPNENLSHQVLGVNIRTQESFAFSPPGFVLPGTKNYPNGVYTLVYNTKDRAFDPNEWFFVASDNRCYNSSVLRHPFTDTGVLPARAPGVAKEPEQPAVSQQAPDSRSLLERGQDIYKNNCAICHYHDKTTTKVGPGLQGIFRRTLTPVRQVPVNDENIRRQVKEGSENMPPYGHIKDEDISALLLYLKSI
jgi:mono/diheme cytochrome c family protein